VIQHKKLIGLKEAADFDTAYQPLFRIDVTSYKNIEVRLSCGTFIMKSMREQLIKRLDMYLTIVVPLPVDAEFFSSPERQTGSEAHEPSHTKVSDANTASIFSVQFIIYFD
jgi:hypothetical protein